MEQRFLKACRGEEVDVTPVWIMRQAGRYLPEYNRIRERFDFLTMCKTPELAAEVTLQPVNILKVDAAILFSDILIPVEAMGISLRFHDSRGPVLEPSVRDKSVVDKLIVLEPEEDVPFVLESIKILRRELEGKTPLIGFSGAPFTLASYMVEGETSKGFNSVKKMLFQSTGLYRMLLEKLTSTVSAYLRAQIRAGAQAVQIFDTWAEILARQDYERYALPYVKSIIKDIKKEAPYIPVIYYINGCSILLESMKETGADVIGLDWRIDIADARKRLGKDISVQGNLDPCCLFMPGDNLNERVKDIIEKAGSRGHIFNLGHGIIPQTPVENAKLMVEAVHRYGRWA